MTICQSARKATWHAFVAKEEGWPSTVAEVAF